MYYHIPLKCFVWTGPLPPPGAQVRWHITIENLKFLEAHEDKDILGVNVVKIVGGQEQHPLYETAVARVRVYMGPKPVLMCCHIDCDAEAGWEIISGRTVDDYTHACTKHVGELLRDAPQHTVHSVGETA